MARVTIDGMAGHFFCDDAMYEMVETSTFNKRQRVWFSHSGRCVYCERVTLLSGPAQATNYATVDHIIPLSKGGRNDMKNYTLACLRCNRLRADMGSDRFAQVISNHNGPIPETHQQKAFNDFFSALHGTRPRGKRRIRVYAVTQKTEAHQ